MIKNLKKNDLIYYSYQGKDDELCYGFARVIFVGVEQVTCSDICIVGNKMNAVSSFELCKEYKLLDIITNRPRDEDIIKEMYPELFI